MELRRALGLPDIPDRHTDVVDRIPDRHTDVVDRGFHCGSTALIINGDARRLPIADRSVDAIVTDPPYGLKFMGKRWDHGLPPVGVWLECLRVLRPGGYLMAFGGTRTYHRLTCAIEDAGFEIRDSILTNTYLAWVYGSGFPKGQGCLKPAWEPVVLARKPGKRVLPLGIAECRVEASGPDVNARKNKGNIGKGYHFDGQYERGGWTSNSGRWPPNLLLTHHPACIGTSAACDGTSAAYDGTCHADCLVRTLGEQSGELKSNPGTYRRAKADARQDRSSYVIDPEAGRVTSKGDTGTAARFFPQFKYCGKATRRDREDGLTAPGAKPHEYLNSHPTVKPTPLMEWLVRLACPEGGTVLDPFMGSGSTGKACMRAGRNFIGVERDAEWLPVARARIGHERAKHPLFAGAR